MTAGGAATTVTVKGADDSAMSTNLVTVLAPAEPSTPLEHVPGTAKIEIKKLDLIDAMVAAHDPRPTSSTPASNGSTCRSTRCGATRS